MEQYDKLIRDKIPERVREKGEPMVTRTAEEEEYWEKLKEKLQEEVDEFLEDEEERELADILEVIRAICDFRDVEMGEIEEYRKEKRERKGGFEDRIILEETEF